MVKFTIGGVIRARAQAEPKRAAITSETESVTWEELYLRARQFASALKASGVRPQDRVSLMERNGIEHFEFIFGCALLNVIPVPLNWRLSPVEIKATIDDAKPKIVIVGAEFHAAIEEIAGDLGPMEILAIGPHKAWRQYGEWRASAGDADPMVEPQPSDAVIHFYSSGTTGKPKGILWSAANAEFLLRDTSVAYGLIDSDVSLLCMPLFHSGGTSWALCGMIRGAESVTLRMFQPDEVMAALKKFKITVAMFVPAMLTALCRVPGAGEQKYAFRQIDYTGSPITEPALLEAMKTFKCNFVQNYGLAETTGGFTQLDVEDHDPGGPRNYLLRSVGKPYPGIELKIMDPETKTECAPGAIGELWTRSGQNMLGYYNNPVETAKTITPEGWLRTGDGGYIDPDGFVFLTDRLKDVIISGGENIYPTEIENVLSAHPAVAEVAVIGVPSERWGETVKAIVALRKGLTATEQELIAYAGAQLAGYKKPTSIDFIEALPRNPTGKILKVSLRQPYWAGKDRRIA